MNKMKAANEIKLCTLAAVFLIAISAKPHAQTPATQFVHGMDTVMQSLKIPGCYVALKIGSDLIIDTGLGWANVEQKIPVTGQTTFRVASVTKTLSSTIIMRLVEKGKLDLDTPVSTYGIDLGNPAITVRHLLTHTSEGEPGSWYHYNGFRFGLLTQVVEKITAKKFHAAITEEVLMPLHMNHSAPGISINEYFKYADENPAVTGNFHDAFVNLAMPYAVDNNNRSTRTEYLNEFGAFGGLVTNAHDLLIYSEAIDRHVLVNEVSQRSAMTPSTLKDGSKAPYGMGWFVQSFAGDEYYWHYGQTQGEGALFLKIPKRKLTLVVTSNSERLSAPFPLGDGDIFSSPVMHLLYKCFLQRESFAVDTQSAAHVRKKELVTRAILSAGAGDTSQLRRIYTEYKRSFARQPANRSHVVASLENVGINVIKTATFKLSKRTKLEIQGIGEMCSHDGSSWCDYGWIENQKGKVIWDMQGKKMKHAGGAMKNQEVNDILELNAGTYALKYKSDGGHAYDNWDDLPPDTMMWGIFLSSKSP